MSPSVFCEERAGRQPAGRTGILSRPDAKALRSLIPRNPIPIAPAQGARENCVVAFVAGYHGH
jgi:hypothetical protein